MKIKVFKTTGGEEVIAAIMSVDDEHGLIRVEFPFLVRTEIDSDTGYTYTDIMPWLFGTAIQGPFNVSINSLAVAPVDPLPKMLDRYRKVVDNITQSAEANVAVTKALAKQQPKRKPIR